MNIPEIKGGQILITGGSGVVGSYVIDSLKEDFWYSRRRSYQAWDRCKIRKGRSKRTILII